MVLVFQSFSSNLSGSLGKRYTLSLDYKEKDKDILFTLKLTPNLTSIYVDTLVDTIYSLVFKLKINEELIFFRSMEIDLRYFTYPIAFSIPYEITKTNTLNLSAGLYVCSNKDSNYIGSSFISEKIFIPVNPEPKNSLILKKDGQLNFSILTLTNFDFIEYKLNDSNWVKTNKIFNIDKKVLKSKNYIRGKR